MPRQYRYFCLFFSVLITLVLAAPIHAAERISLYYGPLGRSFTLTALETFAETGKLDGTLKFLLSRFSPERRSQIQTILKSPFPVEARMFDRFAYTSSGERLLQEVGEIIQSPSRQNGMRGVRSAMTLAAGSPAGVSVLSFLQQFPTDMRIDVRRLLGLVQRVSTILTATKTAVAQLNQQTQQAAVPKTISNNELDLRKPGNFVYQKQVLTFYDAERDRAFAADFYWPETSSEEATLPVIVMSNGLGAGRDRFDEIAPHLASYGFAVVAPDHPGSDRQRLREFYGGLHRENFDASEYLDRPKDITFVLNQLEQINQTELGHRLDLQRVGIFGYSFGGSTALSLAGAEIDFDYLEQDCKTETSLVNISLLYQCRALELPRETVSLKDERIQAAFLFVPFGKSLFGEQGMAKANIPIFWEVTDLDVLTPLAVEQLPAFAALTTPDKYLAITQGLPHARVTYDAIGQLIGSTTPWETLKAIAHNYQNALSAAFFKTYVAQESQYSAYLQPAYAVALTQEPYHLSLVQTLNLPNQ
ncbi:MAG: alpha/beta hydrolase [Cyanobacteria bacterium RM1_2_2]|nr:alpha/beta hydrolase [Cyanobacteria bacterium RM1_2_2]